MVFYIYAALFKVLNIVGGTETVELFVYLTCPTFIVSIALNFTIIVGEKSFRC